MLDGGQRPQLYAGSLDVDVSDIADEVGKAQGRLCQYSLRRRQTEISICCGVLFANCTSLFVEEDIPSDKLGQNAHFASVAPSDRKGWNSGTRSSSSSGCTRLGTAITSKLGTN